MTERPDRAVLDMTIQGMSCTACAARIEKGLGRMKGVEAVSVHYAGKSGSVRYYASLVSPEQIMDRVHDLGFRAALYGSQQGESDEQGKLLLRLVLSILLSLPLLLGMLHHYEWLSGIPLPGFIQEPLLQFVLAAIVQFGIGMPFYFNAYYALRERTANMDVLVAFGTTAAFAYSYYAMLAGLPLYFETSAVVITAVLLGKWLEASISDQALRAATGFERLQVMEAVVLRSGAAVTVRVEELRTGDTLITKAGSRIAADGAVVRGHAFVDESFLTGESMPVSKEPGDPIFAGTMVSGGELVSRIQATGSATMLSRIAALTRQSQSSKSSIGRKVDALAGIFVPLMMLLAIVTLLIWLLILRPGDLSTAAVHALAVVLAACPCALGLAAPISLVLASGRMARRGIVLKEAGVLERLAALDTVVLDKTGTLTEGKPQLKQIAVASGRSKLALLRIAAAAEAASAHPFALALKEEAGKKGLVLPQAEQFQAVYGRGIRARVEGRLIAIGNRRFAEEEGHAISPEMIRFAETAESAGESVLYQFADGICEGAYAFYDPVKRSSIEAVKQLQQSGVEVWLATGDHPAAAHAAAAEAGIRHIHASMLPEDKKALIEQLRQRHRRVAMAGDGWNDAPALAAADVGMAMGDGTEAALAAGHMTLIRARLTGIPDAIRISRLALRNIRQNLAFAFVYNAIVIPFAAFGGLEPWMAGTAMAFSSVSVVGNALRLKKQMERVVQT
ncbi:Cu+-exporting ATPase [Paenibacillus phyllosphaerae]|uniref:P-type Cu(+) transporter n=1 Tax=Paenibacillus phyllosphaerae TaxID=274593 RepID=A0A7W5FLW4_9BACL|nr:heavy metal translocating P-type ATPase [Paenibacillus phyllosphaerae]MBB3109483.1 Cu+-exporting ATPase [Paenibacillus phyllosphaerae]